jgi:hypothetical protein
MPILLPGLFMESDSPRPKTTCRPFSQGVSTWQVDQRTDDTLHSRQHSGTHLTNAGPMSAFPRLPIQRSSAITACKVGLDSVVHS